MAPPAAATSPSANTAAANPKSYPYSPQPSIEEPKSGVERDATCHGR